MKRPRNDHGIFFRLPSALVEQIDAMAYDLQITRTQFIRRAIHRELGAKVIAPQVPLH